ncbi:centromere/kinetochore protein zw10 homolog [Paroedura picta]|uniref:centromere/kinetochore protein zw10 homolog n=1 Tax=Paroedura picta TaxID=143630 RepID=UPI004057A1C4
MAEGEAPGSSLVAAALAAAQGSSGRLEKEGLGRRLSRLSARVEELKGEVCRMISERYVEFLPSMQNARELEKDIAELSSSVDQLKSMIETEVRQDLNVAIAEFTELKQQLERDTLILCVLKQLQEFDSALKQSSAMLSEKRYVPAARHLKKAQRCLKLMESRRGFELKILRALHIELVTQTENLLSVLGEVWQQLAQWTLPPSKEPGSLESTLQTELQLHRVLTGAEDVGISPTATSVLQGLAVLGELHYRFKVFGQLLLNYILKPLVCHPSLQPVLEGQSEGVTLRLESVGTPQGPPSPVEVFLKLRLVLEVLHKHLLAGPLDPCAEDESEVGPVLAEVLGEAIWKELSSCLTDHCLVHSIPNSSSKLGQYIEVIEATEQFEEALKNMRFLREGSTDLLTYARNVNRHFADKKCQDVIVAARQLMMAEIHNTVKVTPESSVALPQLPDSAESDDSGVLVPSKGLPLPGGDLEAKARLSPHTLSFPTCCISESVRDLVALACHTLKEASASTDQYSAQLFYLVRNIFYLFWDVVPMYHKEKLQKLPQLAAIHHNNCMYIAHQLLTLGHQLQGRLGGLLCNGTATFVDLVPVFRRLGAECFLAQMRGQKGELLERLSSARDFSTIDDEDSYAAANKAVRQVLHQLKRLGMVWQGILPVKVYCKAMGTLLNTALAEIIRRILLLEDISAENADRLHALCQILVAEGPRVFVPLPEEGQQNRPFQEEAPLCVPKWRAFQEIMLVLQASLQEIADRWADGKGPLAAEFSPSEVKNLIRALFQNTERRAAVLAKIK